MNEEHQFTEPTKEPEHINPPEQPSSQEQTAEPQPNAEPMLEPSLASLSPQDYTLDPTETPTQTIPEPPTPVGAPVFGAPSAVQVPPPKSHSRKKILIIAAIVLLVICIVIGGYFAYAQTQQNSKQATTVEKTATKKVAKDEPPTMPIVGVKWLATPEAIAYQPIFNEAKLTEYFFDSTLDQAKTKIAFYKIGTDGTKNVIVAKIPPEMGWVPLYVALVQDGTQYTMLKKNSPTAFNVTNGLYSGPELVSTVKTDETQAYTDMLVKDTLAVNGVTAVKVGEWAVLDDALKASLSQEATVPEGTLFSNVQSHSGDSGVKFMSLYLKQPAGVYSLYRYATSILNDDKSVAITWKNGTTTTDAYQYGMVRGGCGIVDAVNVLDKAYTNDLVEAGKTTKGVTIYKLNSATHPAVTTVYDTYKRDDVKVDSQQTFYDANGLVVVKNELGFNVILVNSKYQRAGECGKPVIYLYPQKTTKISVSVGATITKSEPRYNNGWTVIAQPNGNLALNGKTYENLFWEGTGDGVYPTITAGLIVKQSDVKATLLDHLAKLGMNQKETNDFMEFWLPRMPKQPYVRISWLNTQQMDSLAPLTLSKKPDTLIRIFLDSEGLDAPTQIQPQRLTHIPRKGFTVIEWGGLLR